MNNKIAKLLNGEGGNYILPFFWLHGEDESTLREYMQAIHRAGIGAVCVESRPHPDFCGPKWWTDMDIILDEARKYSMKVWILDDSHFPTGYANGALENAPTELCRQGVYCQSFEITGNNSVVHVNIEKYIHPKFKRTWIELLMSAGKKVRRFDDDRLLCVSAVRVDGGECYAPTDLTGNVKDNKLIWQAPKGMWKVSISCLTRNCGAHRNYINMLDEKSCCVLIDTVYEPHYAHYKDDFGKTIAGFFSDEPELGNNHLWARGNVLGTDQDLPWSNGMEGEMENRLGAGWKSAMPLLWENGLDCETTARVRFAYMDAVTRLVERNFSFQIRNWCHEHHVEYIGHEIEDNNQHCRTGTSLGHYFRGLSGQDMAGIDNINWQVIPQGEDLRQKRGLVGHIEDSEFYHYALAKLGASLAAIDPLKKGRTMCELFGNYGWAEGVQLEKYLADHFMVRGVNYFVPHAFNPKKYPDLDCPPHFYAGGNDPQYRHFSCLMSYMNRVCELISDGRHIAPVAILYHGEAEWTGKCMLMQKPAHKLADRQIDYDFIPVDAFSDKERYKTSLRNGLIVNTQEYKALIIPTAQFISAELAKSVAKLNSDGFPVVFLESKPEGIYDGDSSLLQDIQDCLVIPLEGLVQYLDDHHIPEIGLKPDNNRIRCLHYQNGNEMFYLVNEAAQTYQGTVTLPVKGACYAYNAWDNRLEQLKTATTDSGTELRVTIHPRKSLIVLFDDVKAELIHVPDQITGSELKLKMTWVRSICRSIDYPNFIEPKEVQLPDRLATEKPKFSGFVRYESSFHVQGNEKLLLEISDAAEGVELFVNGVSAGLQIVPPFIYNITSLVKKGENSIVIEVATTLERENGRKSILAILTQGKITGLTGITGVVTLYNAQ